LVGGHAIFRSIGLAIAITVGALTPAFAAEPAASSAGRDKRNTVPSVDVIVGLSGPASEPQLEALRDSGLKVRSVMGDVLTGTAQVDKIPGIAEHKLVTTIEASSPLFPE
jgi:hypothetical protein